MNWRALGFACTIGAITALAAATAAFAADPIKQSRSGICWCPGGTSYERTTNFKAFASIEACLEAEGRHPKREADQGQCPSPQERIEVMESELAEARSALAQAEAAAGPSAACENWLRWLEGDTPAGWSDVDRTTFGGHPIVSNDYVAGFVGACRE